MIVVIIKMIQRSENKWYVMFKDKEVLNAMQNDFENWAELHKESYESEGIEAVLDQIAEHYNFTYVAKYTLISVFKNQYNEIVIAWHKDNDKRWSFAEEGFDATPMDLINDYWYQDVISNSEYRDIFYKFNEFSSIPEKLRKAVLDFIEKPKGLNTRSYQNIYHNLYKKDVESFEQIAKKYYQKAQVLKFLKSYGFTKPEIANQM